MLPCHLEETITWWSLDLWTVKYPPIENIKRREDLYVLLYQRLFRIDMSIIKFLEQHKDFKWYVDDIIQEVFEDARIVKYLYSKYHRYDLNSRRHLKWAILDSNHKIIKILIPYQSDYTHSEMITDAIYSGSLKTVRLLLRLTGAPVDLYYIREAARFSKNKEMVKYLAKKLPL